MFSCKASHQQPAPNTLIDSESKKLSVVHQLEREILTLSGLKLDEELHVYDVPIDFETNSFIHTYRCGDNNLETIVLIHGYAGSSLLYYQMLKDLSEKYRVFCIDLLGMGLSSKNEFKCQNTEETIDYFVESIEKWRQAVGIEKFHIAGHSFGGYMSTQYALKYQERVTKLFLLSPAGITFIPGTKSVTEVPNDLPWLRKKLYKTVLGFWEKKTTPSDYFRRHPIIGSFFLNQYLTRQFGGTLKDKKLTDKLHKFFTEMMKTGDGSDKAVFYILRPPRAMAYMPLENLIMDHINVPVVCVYGDRDWMDKNGAGRLENSGVKDFKLMKLENSGHQVTMHNPKGLSEYLLMEVAA